MPPLLVVPDPPRRSATEAVPDLPALSRLIRMGDARPMATDWRAGLLEELGGPPLSALAPAQVAAQGAGVPSGSAVCLATPVHAVAGMNRVHLHGVGVLRLDPAERARLAKSFAMQFGPELRLHEVADGWLLQAPWAAVADDGDPVAQQGAPLARTPASTPALRAMRLAGAEIEMWLAGLEWNRERERRGALTANLLWCWGGGVVRPETPSQGPRAFHVRAAADPWTAGLAKLGGHPLQPPPPDWKSLPQDAVLLLPCEGSPEECWLEWERRWFAPALHDLRERRVDALGVRLGRHGWRIRRRPWRAIFGRSEQWWQALET